MSNTKEIIPKLESIKIAFSTIDDNYNVSSKSLMTLLLELKGNKYAHYQSKYIQAKEKSQSSISKDDFFPSFLPHAYYVGKRKLRDKNGIWDHNRWSISGLIHADLDNIPAEKFDDIWIKLVSTKPFFLFKSPNGGIKCFWYTDLADTYANRSMFKNLTRFTIKNILKSLQLEHYYDDMPTNPNSKCFVTGGHDSKINVFRNFKVVEMQPAIEAVSELHKEEQKLINKKNNILKQAKAAGDYTYFNDFNDSYKDIIKGWANTALTETQVSTKRGGNGSSFRLACKLYNMGMDTFTVNQYVLLFKRHSSKMIFDPVKQVASAMKQTNAHDLGGKIQNDYYIDKIKKLDVLITNVNEKVSKLTHSDERINKRVKNSSKTVADKAVKLSSLSDIDATIFTGLPGSGKSYKMVRQSVDTMITGQITLYICSDLKAFNATVKDSRYDEASKYLNELQINNKISKVQYDRHLINLQTISSEKNEDGSSSAPVKIQFSNALNDLQSGRNGGIIFLTMAALEIINLDELVKNQATIVFDDVSTLPTAKKLSDHFTIEEVENFKKYISFDIDGATHKVKGINKEALDYLDKHGNCGDQNAMVKRIKDARKVKELNRCIYYTFSGKDELSNKTTITQLDMLNLDILKLFKAVYFIGDEIEYNPYVIMLKNRCDVVFKNVHLDCRSINLDKRLKTIYYITDHRFSKTRLGRTQNLPKRIVKSIVNQFKLKNDDALLNLNKDQIGLGIFKKEMDDNFNLTITSPITKGVNNLKANTLVACMFNLDLDISSKQILADITGLTFEQLDTYIHRNNLMQNLFRGTLRHIDSVEECTFIAPSKTDVEYLQKRLKTELNLDVKLQLLDENINKLFVAGINGRPRLNKSGIRIEGNIQRAISRLRKKFGTRIDDIDPNWIVEKMKGLRGDKAMNMFTFFSANMPEDTTSVVGDNIMFKKENRDYSSINLG